MKFILRRIHPNSFWANFDISKLRNVGHKLEYIQPQIHNEVKCMKIVLEDVESEIKYWESVVVCYVLGASPPFSADYSIEKIVLMRNGFILVKFDSIDNRDTISWTTDFTKDKVYNFPIWVQFPELDLKYWSISALMPKYIFYENEEDLLMQQKVMFEWKPILFDKCKNYGRETEYCRKAVGNWQWRPKPIQPLLIKETQRENITGTQTKDG
ncbi:hypothetical protein Cgig2_011771 [Carnegiea gigantea]|uniref:DUF4283 domain-containing protein n=1 Tax=Carnegiea gigantea TaxID=171969 RepID=A0A9Q1Q6U3_9CARY|nr:hypothetical protein Cgig2_011771 [Carnegiea gigantea]